MIERPGFAWPSSSSAGGRASRAAELASPDRSWPGGRPAEVVQPGHHGVIKLGGVELDLAGRALAVQLSIGGRCFVSGTTAGVLYGLRGMPQDRVEVTIDERHRSHLAGDHRIVVTSWIDEARDVTVRADAMRVASPPADAVPPGSGLQPASLRPGRRGRLAQGPGHARTRRATYLAAVRTSGKKGVKRMEHWLEQTSTRPRPSQSGLEVRLRRDDRAGRPADAGASAAADPAVRRAHPPRSRLARRSPGRRAGPLVVARRRPPPAGRSGPRPRLCARRLARPPLRRDGDHATGRRTGGSCWRLYRRRAVDLHGRGSV